MHSYKGEKQSEKTEVFHSGKDLQELSREIERLKDKLADKGRENDRLRGQRSGRYGEQDDLKNKLKKMQNEMEDVEEERNSLKSQTKKLKREKNELEEDLEDMSDRMRELRGKMHDQVDPEMLRKKDKEIQNEKNQKEDLERKVDRLQRDLEEKIREAREREGNLEQEKSNAAEKTYKTIVELKTQNEDEMSKFMNEVKGKDGLIMNLMKELKEIKDYTGKLEKEIFDLSKEKGKFEENLKRIMESWETEEIKRYSSEKLLNGELKGREDENRELKQKLRKIDALYKDDKEKINRKADFYKKKSDNLERTRNELNRKIEDLEKTLKQKTGEKDREESHLEMGSIGSGTMIGRDEREVFDNTKNNFRDKSKRHWESDEKSHVRIRREVTNTTVKMDGDLIKMLYTQAKFIDEKIFGESDSEEEQEVETMEMQDNHERVVQGRYHSTEEDKEYEDSDEAYQTEGRVQYVNVDNTQSSDPQKMYANGARVMVNKESDNYLGESEAEDGDKLVPAYYMGGKYYPIEQVQGISGGNRMQSQSEEMMDPRAMNQHEMEYVNVGEQDMDQEDFRVEDENENDLIHEEYSDIEEEHPVQANQAYMGPRGVISQNDQVGAGHLVAGPVLGNHHDPNQMYQMQHRKEIDYEEDEEDEMNDEEDYEEDYEERQYLEGHQQVPMGSGHFQKEMYMENKREIQQPENFSRKPALTFGPSKK